MTPFVADGGVVDQPAVHEQQVMVYTAGCCLAFNAFVSLSASTHKCDVSQQQALGLRLTIAGYYNVCTKWHALMTCHQLFKLSVAMCNITHW